MCLQVRCSQESRDMWDGGVSLATFRAEISLAKALTALSTISWYPSKPSGGFETASVRVPPGMAFDTNFYCGDFGNAQVFGLGCGARHYEQTRLALSIFMLAEGMLNVAATTQGKSRTAMLLGQQVDAIFGAIDDVETDLAYTKEPDASAARQSWEATRSSIKLIVQDLQDEPTLIDLLTRLKAPQHDAKKRYEVAAERDGDFFAAMNGVRRSALTRAL